MPPSETPSDNGPRPVRVGMSIFHKIMVTVLLLLLVAVGVGTLITVKLESRAMTALLISSVEVTAQNIASITRNAFGSLNWAYLEEFLHELGKEQPGGIVSARVVNPQGEVYMAQTRALYGDTVDTALLTGQYQVISGAELNDSGEVGLLMVKPLRIGQQEWHILLGISQVHVQAAVAELIKRSLFWSVLIVLLATAAVYWIARTITRPLIVLTETAHRISSGDLSLQADVHSRDEVGLLADTFNRMVSSLGAAQTDLQTSLLALEDANRRLADESEQARHLADKAQQASIAKSQFLANMSHEIRTPLNGVISMLDLMQDTELTDGQREYIAMAATSAESLLALINDILDFSRIEAGYLELSPQPFNLEQELERMMAILSARAREKKIDIIMHYDARAPRQVHGDHLRLRQILFNLGWNAIKFTHQGYILVEVSCENVTETSGRFEFSVKDTGIGIAADQLQNIFEHFTQADYSSTRQYGGAGLGLAICRRLVALMGGELQVESVAGKGSRFFFAIELPLLAETAAPSEPLPVQGLHALVVDDNDTNRRILVEYLNTWQVSCDVAASGQEALDILDHLVAAGKTCDVALIDHAMPEMDGLELAARVKAQACWSNLPLIILTSHWGHLAMSDIMAAGFTVSLPKPTGRSDLLAGIRTALFSAHHAPERPSECPPATPREKPPSVEAAARTGLKVLLVEDHPINRKSVLMMLRKLGIEAVTANNGQEAVDQVIRCPPDDPFDVILMDCQMPVMDGYDATRRIREWEHKSAETPSEGHIPIIALTANALEGDREKCLAAGMTDYLAKPFTQKAFESMLAAWLPRKAPHPPAAPAKPAPNSRSQVFNDQDTLERYDQDSEIIQELLNDFLTETPADLQALQAFVQADDSAAEKTAHRLKGACSYMGADRMRDLCMHIMTAVTAADWPLTRDLTTDLEAEWQAFQEAARRWEKRVSGERVSG